MLRLIDGPEGYLNVRADGPYAFCEEKELAAYNATRWLFDYALDAVDTHDMPWSDFGDADGVLASYALRLQDTETGEIHEKYISPQDITPKGVGTLNSAVRGEDVERLFEAWRNDIYDDANSAE